MSVRTIHRSQLASRSSKVCLSLRPTIDRANHGHALQLRMLWWCHHTRDWQTNHDEYMAEGIKRHEKIMRHKYSKAIRRRALWERDESHPWSWRVTKYLVGRHQANQSLSTSQQDRTPPRGHPEPAPAGKEENDWFKPRDLDSFKAFVDRQVARNPYAALFGRRLQSPPSTNKSSWTSFSWILTPGRAEQQTLESTLPGKQHPPTSRPLRPTTSSSTAPDKPPGPATTASDSLDNYEYDPITMRKVPKRTEMPKTTPSKPFLESLFSEHGVDIPVRTHKPHKVYGYGLEEKPASLATKADDASPEQNFASSRKSELVNLMSRAKGNHIDTTALYTEAIPDTQTRVQPDTTGPNTQTRASSEPDDDTPLFSGTAYQDRARLSPNSQSTSNWLVNEGFKSEDTSSPQPPSSDQDSNRKLTPALDRIQAKSAQTAKKEPARLQTSLDRHLSSAAISSTSGEAKTCGQQDLRPKPEHQEEPDIDLLRASDIRAATKSARITKQDIDQNKRSTRIKLEASFEDQQNDPEAISGQVSHPAQKLSQGLNNVWNHIRQYPSGIVAKTINSIPVFKENYKKYERGSQASDLNEKIFFDQDALNRTASIYKPVRPSTLRRFTPSKEYEKENLESSSRTESLKASTQKAKQQSEDTNTQLLRLAADIKAVYEAEYGPITSRHRQVSPLVPTSSEVSSTSDTDKRTETKTPHPLSTASVKPGVAMNSAIDNHINVFEPRHATIVDEMKKSKSSIQGLETEITSIKSQESTARQPTEIPPPVFTAPGSSVWNDEQPPLIEALRTTPSFTFPFVVLKYDHQSDKVVATETRNGSKFDGVAPIDPIKVLARVDNAASYLPYFSNLARSGYELCHGGSKVLVFRKKLAKPCLSPGKTAGATSSPGPITPMFDQSSQVAPSQAKVAATVLDEIPIEVVPTPGPAAPTAPSASRYDNVMNSPQVRRQEDVFSGTIRSPREGSFRFNPSPSNLQKAQEEAETEADRDPTESTQHANAGFGHRIRRAFRTLVIWTTALGAGAYVIGVAAEGIGAQSQAQKGIHDSNALGPRKRVVLPAQQAERQRPGIFSTESSR